MTIEKSGLSSEGRAHPSISRSDVFKHGGDHGPLIGSGGWRHAGGRVENKKGQGYPALYQHQDHLAGGSPLLRRCLRLISPCMAADMNLPVLSPGSFICSMPSMSSWATRIVTDCDFAFLGPVVIATPHTKRCKTIYTKKSSIKALNCKTPKLYSVLHQEGVISRYSTPRSAWNHIRGV